MKKKIVTKKEDTTYKPKYSTDLAGFKWKQLKSNTVCNKAWQRPHKTKLRKE